MGTYFRYAFLLLTVLCAFANATPASWIFVDGSEPKGWPDGPAGCQEVSTFSLSYDVPLLETGEREFNEYRVYACEKQKPKRYVVWRIRHYKGQEQWVGELRFDWSLMNIVKTKSQLNAKYGYQVFSGWCRLKSDTASVTLVNALLHGVAGSRADPMKYLVVAWKVDKESKRLVRIPPTAIRECGFE